MTGVVRSVFTTSIARVVCERSSRFSPVLRALVAAGLPLHDIPRLALLVLDQGEGVLLPARQGWTRWVVDLQALLFNQDWHNDVFRLSEDDVKSFRHLYCTDPDAARTAFVMLFDQKVRLNPRLPSVEVVDFDRSSRLDTPPGFCAGPTPDMVVRGLLREKPDAVAAYSFHPRLQGSGCGEMWFISLGWGAFVVARDRDPCVALATAVRLHGRKHPHLSDWVFFLLDDGDVVCSANAPEEYPSLVVPATGLQIVSPSDLLLAEPHHFKTLPLAVPGSF